VFIAVREALQYTRDFGLATGSSTLSITIHQRENLDLVDELLRHVGSEKLISWVNERVRSVCWTRSFVDQFVLAELQHLPMI